VPPSGGVPTLAGDSVALSSGRRRRADPDAQTMAAGPNDMDVPAPTEALFGTTAAHLPEPRSNTGIVFMVAGAALAAGIVGGFLFLRKSAPRPDALDTRTSFVPAASAPAATEPPPVAADDEPGTEQESDEEPSRVDAGPDASADAAVADAAVADAGVSPRPASTVDVTGLDASATATSAPDGGWQKPDWATPDDEIPVRRGPGEEDDKKIVIPKEEPYP
jgi:hypothetical protein